jgi:hypothetical protein
MINAQTEANNLGKNSVHFNLLLQLQLMDTMALVNVSTFVSYMPTHLQNYTNVNMKL